MGVLMTVLVLMVMVVRPGVRDRGGALADLRRRHKLLLSEHVLEGVQPVLVVAAPVAVGSMFELVRSDLGDQAFSELLEVDRSGIVKGDRETERPALPRRSNTSSPFFRGSAAGPDAVASAWTVDDVMRCSLPTAGTAEARCRPCCPV